MACIDRNAKGIVLVADEDRRLIGTLTDGDLRRAVLAQVDLDSQVSALLDQKESDLFPTPVTASAGTDGATLIELMNRNSLRHIPLLDETGRIAGLAVLTDLVKEIELPLKAVVMAGGLGQRLGPLTADIPKPMLPVGGTPLLHRIVEQLRSAGIRRVHLTTHYRAEAISDYFGTGKEFGVEIDYVNEKDPLGTAGALGMVGSEETPLLVMNGDIITQVNLHEFLHFHTHHRAAMTVAVQPYEVNVPYGVVEIDGVEIVDITEKPLIRRFVNAGIYLVTNEACRMIRPGERVDMPDLIRRVLDAELRVAGFPLREYWLDIGHHEDYERANIEAGWSEA